MRAQVIKVDQLVEYIRKLEGSSKDDMISEKAMEEAAVSYLKLHKKSNVDVTKKFYDMIEVANSEVLPPVEINQTMPNPYIKKDDKVLVKKAIEMICPTCGSIMIKRTATKGKNSGNEFYGCRNFPKCRCIVNLK